MGCATTQVLRPMEEADASGEIVKEGNHRFAVRLLTPTYSAKIEELPTFSVAITNQGDEPLSFGPDAISISSGSHPVEIFTAYDLTTRLREEAAREAERYTGQQAEVFLASGPTNPDLQDNSAAIAKISAAKRTNLAAGQAHPRHEDQIKEIAQILVPMHVPAGETESGLLKLNPSHIREGEPLQIDIHLDGETHRFVFAAETR